MDGGGVADAGGHAVGLGGNADGGTDGIPIGFCAGELDVEIVIFVGSNVAPDLDVIAERRDDDVDFSVAI